jgi:hypothetical protein
MQPSMLSSLDLPLSEGQAKTPPSNFTVIFLRVWT